MFAIAQRNPSKAVACTPEFSPKQGFATLPGAKASPETRMQNAVAGAPVNPKRKSVFDIAGGETELLPVATNRAEVPELLRQPPPEPIAASLPHGQLVQPVWSPPSPKQKFVSGAPMSNEMQQVVSVVKVASQYCTSAENLPSPTGIPPASSWSQAM